MFGETFRNSQILAVLPDEHILELLEINGLQAGVVLGLVAQVSVGQADPGELPGGSEAQLDVGPAQATAL